MYVVKSISKYVNNHPNIIHAKFFKSIEIGLSTLEDPIPQPPLTFAGKA